MSLEIRQMINDIHQSKSGHAGVKPNSSIMVGKTNKLGED